MQFHQSFILIQVLFSKPFILGNLRDKMIVKTQQSEGCNLTSKSFKNLLTPVDIHNFETASFSASKLFRPYTGLIFS